MDDEPSAMQFSTAVGTRLESMLPGSCITQCVQIRSKGVVDPRAKLKARKATDPPPVHNDLGRQPVGEPEQGRATVMYCMPFSSPRFADSLHSTVPQ